MEHAANSPHTETPMLCRQFQLLAVKHFQHLRQIMSAFDDGAGHGNNNPRALFAGQRRALLDPV